MTKDELRTRLQKGHILDDLFEFQEGQECWIYKAEKFIPGAEILYIPDTDPNGIPVAEPPHSHEEIEDILEQCYTGDDFLEECGGDVEMAKRLFHYVDWQHPSAAVPEIADEEEDLPEQADRESGSMRGEGKSDGEVPIL